VHQRFRHEPCWQPIYRKRYSFIIVTLCSVVVFCSTAVIFCEVQCHGDSACYATFALGKPS